MVAFFEKNKWINLVTGMLLKAGFFLGGRSQSILGLSFGQSVSKEAAAVQNPI